jgi:hypothetical protein
MDRLEKIEIAAAVNLGKSHNECSKACSDKRAIT